MCGEFQRQRRWLIKRRLEERSSEADCCHFDKCLPPEKGTRSSRSLATINTTMERKRYLQLTLSVTVVSYFSPSFMARLNTTHLNFAPSSSLVGVMVSVLVVWWSLEPPRFTMACRGAGLPSRYHLAKLNVTGCDVNLRVRSRGENFYRAKLKK